MSRRLKLFLLIGLTVVLVAGVIIQTKLLFKSIHQVGPPMPRSRYSDVVQPQMWMTVSDLSRHCKLPETEIFQVLQISPVPGDEQLSLRSLGRKYDKSPAELQQAVKELVTMAGKKP